MNPFIHLDCQRTVPNRFDLVHLAAGRSHSLARGEDPKVPATGPILDTALREIASGALTLSEMGRLWPAQAWLQPPGEPITPKLAAHVQESSASALAAPSQTSETLN